MIGTLTTPTRAISAPVRSARGTTRYTDRPRRARPPRRETTVPSSQQGHRKWPERNIYTSSSCSSFNRYPQRPWQVTGIEANGYIPYLGDVSIVCCTNRWNMYSDTLATSCSGNVLSHAGIWVPSLPRATVLKIRGRSNFFRNASVRKLRGLESRKTARGPRPLPVSPWHVTQ